MELSIFLPFTIILKSQTLIGEYTNEDDKSEKIYSYKFIIKDKNGEININDFLIMSNDEITSYNNHKKFSILIMNPPYDKSLHLKFLEKVIDIADNVISIQPSTFLINQKQ